MKTMCRNAMLLGDMNICRLMNHSQQNEGDKIRNMLRKIRSLALGTMTIWWKSLTGSAKVFSSSRVPSSKNSYDQKGKYQALNLMEVFQEPRLTPLAVSVVRNIRGSVLQEKWDVLGAVSLVTG